MAIQGLFAGHRYLFWRLPLLAATLVVVATAVESFYWGFVLCFPLVAGMSAAFLFDPKRLQLWTSKGLLIAADAVMVSLALLGTSAIEAGVWIGFFGVVLVATWIGDRLKALLASGALLGALTAAAAAAGSPWLPTPGAAAVYLAFLVCCALSFGALSEQLTGHPQAVARAKQETGQLWALLEMTDAIGSTLDVGQVMRSVVRLVGDLVDSDSCSILLVDEKLRSCYVVASKGHPDVDMLELHLDKYPEVRRALLTREPVIVEDVENDPLVESVREILLEKGYRSLLVVPLLFGKEVLGTLFLRARRESPFNEDEIRFCKVAAGTSANALKNALLYQEVTQEAERHRATSDKLGRVLDSSPDMIVATDTEGRITEFNAGAEQLTGWSAERAGGRSFAAILGKAELDAVSGLTDGQTGPEDAVFQSASGKPVEISLVSAPLSASGGGHAGRVWIGRDVSKLRRVEKSLARAERLSSLGEVVAGVAHELNNPLSGVMGYAELLRKQTREPGQVRDLERIVESSMRCQKIVYKLLSFARKHPPAKRHQDLNECVSRVIDLKSYHLRSSQIATHLELNPDLPRTRFDFHQIEQVILNLLNNAEQAISSLKTPGQVRIGTGRQDGFIFVEVEDNGPGVPPAIRDRIFDPFFTTKDVGQGTGLGLSVSFGIVEEHGGRIEYRPAGGDGGACFTVFLPITVGEEEEVEPEPPEVEREVSPLQGLRVLVAEDEPLVLELFDRVLSEDGADVTLAHDGGEAWQQIENGDFDLIVADLRMPNMDGQRLYEKVAAERPDMLRRFVFATGDLVREETLAFLQDLPNRILTKPLEVETVRRVLSQVVDG